MQLLAVLIQVVLHDLVSPMTFVPAIAIGWFARTTAQRLAGVAALTVAKLMLSLLEPLPDGAERIWAAMPVMAVAPLAWVFVVAALRGWLRREAVTHPASGRLRATRGVIGAVIGAPVGALVGTLLGMAAVEVFQVSAFEGAAGYFVAFLFFVPGVVIGAIAGAIIGARRGPRSA